MVQILIDNPLLLLFIVGAIGYPLGRIKIGGTSLGIAAVLFAGLGVGALHPDLKLPEIVYLLGLVLFVYTIGLSSGASFFASLRHKGVRDNLLVVSMLALGALLTALAQQLLALKPTLSAGMFAGTFTNTPALAGILDYIKSNVAGAALDQALAEPVVGYSITYPIGVVGMIVTISLLQRFWKIDYGHESRSMRESSAISQPLQVRIIRVTRPEATDCSLHDLKVRHQQQWNVVVGRMKRNGKLSIATGQTKLAIGDLVSVVGTAADLDRVTACLGEPSDERIELDRSTFDYRRMFVSNPHVAGHRLSELRLPQQFGAIVTRVRRGDVELLPHGDTVLELGDRVRVLTSRENMDAVSTFFGDSYRALSEIDILTFSLGIALGLLLGLIPLPLPGGVSFKLGFAGGPLIVALILGALGRSGPMVWNIPYSANLTLRQIGLILFLAGVGTRSGYTFVTMFAQGGGIAIFVAGALITCITAFTTLWIGHRWLNIPMGLLIGMAAGMQTQPAVLGFALEQTENDLPNIGYATVYPIATITKILFAQLLLAFLSR